MSALYGFGEQPARRAVGCTVSLALKYDYRQWALALGYQKLNNGDAAGVRSPNASSSFTVSPVNAGYLSADAVRYFVAALRYKTGDVTLGANASNVTYRPGAGSLFDDTAVFNTGGLLANYQLSSAWLHRLHAAASPRRGGRSAPRWPRWRAARAHAMPNAQAISMTMR